MLLVAKLDWAFPRQYAVEGGSCYSYLFQNRFKKDASNLFILVAHNPPADWLSLEVNESKREEDIPRDVTKTLHRIRGLFSFNYRSRAGDKLPVLHANPVTSDKLSANAVFVNVSNKHAPNENYRYLVEDEEIAATKSIHFVSQLGPFRLGGARTIYRNRLIGVLPFNTHITRVQVEDDQVVATKRFVVDPEEGLKERGEVVHDEGAVSA